MDANDRTIVGLAMVSHALIHTYEMTIPVLMVIWLSEFSVTAATLGLVVAVGYALFGIGALPSGIVVDRFGSQRMIAICLLGMGLSFALLSIAHELWIVAIAIWLWGAAASIYHPAGLSLISKGVKESGAGFGYHGMAGNAGIAVGPFVAIVLLWVLNWHTVTLLMSIPSFAAILLILGVQIDEQAAVTVATNGSGEARRVDSVRSFLAASRSLFVGGFVAVFFIVVFNGLYYRGILTFLPDMLADFITDIQFIEANRFLASDAVQFSDFVYVGLLGIGIGGQYVGGRAIERIPVEKGLLSGYVALFLIALLFIPATQTNAAAVVTVSLLLGFCLFLLQPMYQFAVSEYSPADTRGLSYGYTYLAQFGVGALGAAIIGYTLTYSVPAIAFVVIAAFALLAMMISFLLYFRN